MNGEFVLVTLILIGLVSRSPIITTAACILLIVKLVHLERYLPTIERRGLEFGLLFLTIDRACSLCGRVESLPTIYGQPYLPGQV